MNISRISFILWFFLVLLSGCKKDDPDKNENKLQLTSIEIGGQPIALSGTPTSGLPPDQSIEITFSSAVNSSTAPSAIEIVSPVGVADVDFGFQSSNKTVLVTPVAQLSTNTIYTIRISNELQGASGEVFDGIEIQFKTTEESLTIVSYKIGGQPVINADRIINVPLDLTIEINFSAPLDVATTSGALAVVGPGTSSLSQVLSDDNMKVTIHRTSPLTYLSEYSLTIANTLRGEQGEVFPGISRKFYSEVGGHTSGLPARTDDELLTLVQQQTFKYFWDLADPASGMARERNTSGTIVTSGGSGFGIMAIIVASERGFITRAEAVTRLAKIVGFLETADRFHGAWAHWMNGNTGNVVPFSSNDNGGDLVETSFLIQGLITFRQYLDSPDTVGNNLINRITGLYNSVEWDWYRRCEPTCQDVLYWHWSPDKGWIMNFPLYGYFEEQITYLLAASSPTHGIPKVVYTNGFGKNGTIVKNNVYYGYTLPLESPAPLFWVQYSYLGLNPNFSDDFADYWMQNVNSTLISHAYCSANPLKFAGYSDASWGLTASDDPTGYGAHSVGSDNGTISPTAALSSFPYTPEESMKATRFFYDTLGDRIWGEYGFVDAYNVTSSWYADSYLAIDQGPIIVMIENYRTGLLWDLFLSAPEVQTGMSTIDFEQH